MVTQGVRTEWFEDYIPLWNFLLNLSYMEWQVSYTYIKKKLDFWLSWWETCLSSICILEVHV